MTNQTRPPYDGLTRLLHWGMALLILWQLLKLGDRINDGEHWIGQTLVPWHVSVGVLILVLAVVRLVWALKQGTHRPHYGGTSETLARIGHYALYAVMFLLPISGIIYLVGGGYGFKAFGVTLIRGTEIETPWMQSVGALHSPLAWLFLILIIGHIAAALYHHFALKDDTVRRMIGSSAK